MGDLDRAAAMAIEHAAALFADRVLQCDPTARFASAMPDRVLRVETDVPLSPELVHWYRYLAPVSTVVIPQLGNFCKVYGLEELAANQVGYRWQGLLEGSRGKRLDGWPSSWLTIGDIGADPIIADTGNVGTPILYCMHGTGNWHPHLIAPTLAAYLKVQATWIEICLVETGEVNGTNWVAASELIWDDRGNYLPPIANALRRALRPLVPDECLRWWTD